MISKRHNQGKWAHVTPVSFKASIEVQLLEDAVRSPHACESFHQLSEVCDGLHVLPFVYDRDCVSVPL